MLVKNILISLRPKQWTKNLVLFAGLVFSQNFFNPSKFFLVFAAALIFCLASSGIYFINDVLDIEFDKYHPKKKHRPIASGKLSIAVSRIVAYSLLIWSLGTAFFLNTNLFLILGTYVTIEMLYSVYFKNAVILDIFCIASGFFLRVMAGALVIDVPISNWLLICTIFVSLFLALAKRRSEMVMLEEGAKKHRRVLSEYSLSFVDQMITIVAASTVLSYVLYTCSAETIAKFHTRDLEYSIIFVVYGIFRYLYLVYQKNEGGSPESIIFSDGPMRTNIILYFLIVGISIYRL